MIIQNIIGDHHNVPKVWGLLCIDCWETETNQWFYEQAVCKLEKFNISAVVNCCTNIRIDYSDKSIHNTLKHYLWNPETKNETILLDLLNCAGDQIISQHLHRKFFDNQSIHLSNVKHFRQHQEKHWPYIQDWIIIGSAWNICVHYGPLGIHKLSQGLPTSKFNIFPEWSIQDEYGNLITEKHLQEDSCSWSIDPLISGCYRLIKSR